MQRELAELREENTELKAAMAKLQKAFDDLGGKLGNLSAAAADAGIDNKQLNQVLAKTGLNDIVKTTRDVFSRLYKDAFDRECRRQERNEVARKENERKFRRENEITHNQEAQWGAGHALDETAQFQLNVTSNANGDNLHFTRSLNPTNSRTLGELLNSSSNFMFMPKRQSQ